MHEGCMKNGLRSLLYTNSTGSIYLEHIFPAFKIKGKRLYTCNKINIRLNINNV